MTFVEIKSKRLPCLFLSNQVKNDVNTACFYCFCVLGGVTDRKGVGGGGVDGRPERTFVTIICSYQKSMTRQAAWKELSEKNAIFLSSELITDLLNNKVVGRFSGSALPPMPLMMLYL